MILLSVNALLSDCHLSPHNSGLEALIKDDFFSTKVCDLGLHFVAKRNYFSNTDFANASENRWRPIIGNLL